MSSAEQLSCLARPLRRTSGFRLETSTSLFPLGLGLRSSWGVQRSASSHKWFLPTGGLTNLMFRYKYTLWNRLHELLRRAFPYSHMYAGRRHMHTASGYPAPPNHPLRYPKYHLIETKRPLTEVHWGSRTGFIFGMEGPPGVERVWVSKGTGAGSGAERGRLKPLCSTHIYIYIFSFIVQYLYIYQYVYTHVHMYSFLYTHSFMHVYVYIHMYIRS